MPEQVATAVTAVTVSLSSLIRMVNLAAMLALVATAETAVPQRPEVLATPATEPMLAGPETADLRQAVATAEAVATALAVATAETAVVPLASTATAETADPPAMEATALAAVTELVSMVATAVTVDLRARPEASLVQRGQAQAQQERAAPWERKAMAETADKAEPQPRKRPARLKAEMVETAEVPPMESLE